MRRKLWQFRLRSLFVLVLFSALAAAWWSHRRYCLERAEFHEQQAAQDRLEADQSFLAAMRTYLVKQRQLAQARTTAMEEKRAKLKKDAAKKLRAAMQPSVDFDGSVSEGQRIASSIRGGYLIVPVESAKVLQVQQPEPPKELTSERELPYVTILQSSERRENALKARAEFHTQQKEKYLRAIFRPWMSLQESPPPKVSDDPSLVIP